MMDDLWRRDDVASEDQVRTVRTEYADEETEAAELEAAENAADQVSPSALMHRRSGSDLVDL